MPDYNSPVNRYLDTVDWKVIPHADDFVVQDGVPHATHEGILRVGDASLKVYQLSDGQRVIDANDFARFCDAAS